LIAAGFTHIDAVSFVSPKAVRKWPIAKVLEQIDVPADVEIIGIVVNEKAPNARSAARCQHVRFSVLRICDVPAQEPNQTVEDALKVLQSIKMTADKAGRGSSFTFRWRSGIRGEAWNEEEVLRAVRTLTAIGIRSISLADTVGLATPDLIQRVVESVTREYADYDIGVHLHSVPGNAAAKVLAAQTQAAADSIRRSVGLVAVLRAGHAGWKYFD
jgi:hydroxymethylglutaryl-CoA lyase